MTPGISSSSTFKSESYRYPSLSLYTHTAPPPAEIPTQGTALPQGQVVQRQTCRPGCTSGFLWTYPQRHLPHPHQGLEYNQPGQSQELIVFKAVQMILIFSKTMNHESSLPPPVSPPTHIHPIWCSLKIFLAVPRGE